MTTTLDLVNNVEERSKNGEKISLEPNAVVFLVHIEPRISQAKGIQAQSRQSPISI
jgi:hypothetical protein